MFTNKQHTQNAQATFTLPIFISKSPPVYIQVSLGFFFNEEESELLERLLCNHCSSDKC